VRNMSITIIFIIAELNDDSLIRQKTNISKFIILTDIIKYIFKNVSRFMLV
jgi:hypothetical protein